MQNWFNTVQSALQDQPEVEQAIDTGVTEVNKTLSPNFTGGGFFKTFTLTLTPAAKPEPWEYTELATKIQSHLQQNSLNTLLVADDDPVRLIAVEESGYGDDRQLVAKAYIIPDPE